MKEWKKDFLTVRCFETREKMGDAAAADIEAAIWAVLSRKENCAGSRKGFYGYLWP